MPIVSGTQVDIDAATETPEIPLLSIKVIKGGFGVSNAITQTPPALTGRDRAPELAIALSDGVVSASRPLRIRRSAVTIAASTQTSEARYVVSPPLPAPDVQLFHDLKPIGDASVIRGVNFDLSFLATGHKLSTLWAEFQILDLSDRVLVRKIHSLAPGGAIIDELNVLPNGMEEIKGSVFILGEDTRSLPEECKYAFLIGNRFSRKYEPICGHLTFSC